MSYVKLNENNIVVQKQSYFEDGFLKVSENVICGQILQADGSFANPPHPPLTADDVSRERDRRLALGFDYDFGDSRGVHRFATTRGDMEGWDEVSKASEALRSVGQGATTIDIVTDTGPVQITADEWPLILIAAAQYRQPIWQASFILQAMDPIPADYADNQRWP